jgi:chromosomal replication initiation ATPase DnaA
MFLTTNRAEDFDEAFMSRIYLIIDYKPLDAARRKKILQNLAENIGNKDVKSLNDDGFNLLAEKYDINGREIKNMLRTAWSLAKKKGEPLSLAHVELVAGIGLRKYLGA